MTGETNLQTLLATMHPVLRSGEYVYVLWPHGRPLAPGIEAAVREAEGLTAVLPRAEADALGLNYDFVAAWITLEVHSELEAVGLTAAVSRALTDARISCNVLAGFHHDHLLVSVGDSARALEVLAELSAAHAPSHEQVREVKLRSEKPEDREAILALTAEAFSVSPVTGLPVDGEPVEVDLLRRLFDSDEYLPELSVVAEVDGEIVGHAISTRAWADGLELLGLGPIGVTPRLQRHGIGSALMRETVIRANAAGERGIALLGSTDYYPRFGFVPASSMGIEAPDKRWGDNFQFLPLALWPGGVHGTFRYAEPFSATESNARGGKR
ncbi:putative N-acetyltransferase YhbS [Arthrobacter pascens]|uniref:N-acetyltransferase n=1 Tax=Arthrobacter pascens TaxID=1677 RepID=UPI002863FCD1|nr:N-acetyltransferase [Arthrobacter pascens]MDR6557022.1 putative N-acetyltransferase YhbS [Arthrobacter pascens]